MPEHTPDAALPPRIDPEVRPDPAQVPPPEGPVAGMDGFFHRYADANGVRLHYVIGGSGPAIVLVHGWPFAWREWRKLMPLLADAGFTVIAPDLRGMGDSEKPETGYAKRNVAEDLHQLVDHLGLSEVNLVGTDIGTMVAHAYATAYPGEIRRLVLSEAMLPGFGLEEIMNVAAGGSWHFGFHMQVDLAEMLTAGKEAAYLGGMWDVMTDGGITENDRRELLRTYAGPRGMRGGFMHYVPLLEDGKANRAAATVPLPMPVLVLNGERGLPQPPLLAGVEQLASDVQTDIVPDAAHTIGADNPEWLAGRLTRLIAPASATSAS